MQYLVNGECIIEGDMVHFLNNRRSQILFSIISVDYLIEIFGDSAVVNDRSSLSKLQDTFPPEIFNCQVLWKTFRNKLYDSTFFMYPLVCWNDAFNNQEFGLEIRLFLLECAIFGFTKFYDIQKEIKRKTNIISQIAIKRGFAKVSIVWKKFHDSIGVFNFAQHGTMLQEHYHALIRGMARGIDTLTNTLNCISKSSIVYDIQKRQRTKTVKRARYSVGGTHYDLSIHKINFGFDLKSFYLIERLTEISIFGNYQEFDDNYNKALLSFYEIIGYGSLRIKNTSRNFHQGRHILSREITNDNDSNKWPRFI